MESEDLLEVPAGPGAASGRGAERWNGLPDERFLDCVHCGLCLSACPTYVELGTEMDSPRGRIYLMKGLRDGDIAPTAEVVRHLDLCLGCRACETACPSGVHYGELIEAARTELARSPVRPRLRALWVRAIQEVFPSASRLRALLAPLRLAQSLGLGGLLRVLPFTALLPELGAAEALPPEIEARGEERRRVGLLPGCVNQVLFARVNAATVRVLARNGCRVLVRGGDGCCGALHLHAGERRRAQQMARVIIDSFPEDLDAIVVNAAGCGASMKEYGALLRDDPKYAEKARRFAAKVADVTELLAALPVVPPPRVIAAQVTYHDACHLAHAQGVRQAPRTLLRAVSGIELVELEEADHCCGSAGSYNLTEPAMAKRLARRKVERVLATGARYVFTANPGCALQIAAGLRRAGSRAEVLHPVELLDRAYEE